MSNGQLINLLLDARSWTCLNASHVLLHRPGRAVKQHVERTEAETGPACYIRHLRARPLLFWMMGNDLTKGDARRHVRDEAVKLGNRRSARTRRAQRLFAEFQDLVSDVAPPATTRGLPDRDWQRRYRPRATRGRRGCGRPRRRRHHQPSCDAQVACRVSAAAPTRGERAVARAVEQLVRRSDPAPHRLPAPRCQKRPRRPARFVSTTASRRPASAAPCTRPPAHRLQPARTPEHSLPASPRSWALAPSPACWAYPRPAQTHW
jgi:hypothetical protein